jgi:hypothetical protein
MYYYGDDVTLAAGSARQLDTVTLTFGLYTNSGGGSYTPNLQVSIFAIDPTTRLPTGTSIGNASVNNVIFTGGNSDPLTPFTFQQVTFDFTGQNVILPDDFAFVYRDNNPDANDTPGVGFSVLGADPSSASVGSTIDGFLQSYPNGGSSTGFQFGANGFDTATGNLLATITADAVVPEPSSFVMALTGMMGGLGYAWRRRKSRTA